MRVPPGHKDVDNDNNAEVAEIEGDDAITFGGGIGDKKKPSNVTVGRKNQQCRSVESPVVPGSARQCLAVSGSVWQCPAVSGSAQ